MMSGKYIIKYIELKTGYSDDGPAWIGRVKMSKKGDTIYFNNHAYQKKIGCYANYYDIESSDEYWISGIKRDGQNRHWAGGGKIMIDRKIVEEYVLMIDEKELNKNKYHVVDIEDSFPIERINALLNGNQQL